MRKCPYCAENIQDDAIKCRYCGEMIEEQKGTPESKSRPKPKIVIQHPSAIKAAVILILSKDILAIIFGLIGGETISSYAATLFWDLFFAYHLLKMKNWARLWTIARTIIGMLYLAVAYIAEVNYFAMIIDLSILSCILVLLFGAGSKKKAVIVSSIYFLLILVLLGFVGLGIIYEKETLETISSSSLIKEQKSEAGFKVVLPSDSWRFLKKEDSIEIIGGFVKDSDMCIANLSGSVFGIFIGEDITGIEIDLDETIQYVKEEVFNNMQIVNEGKAERTFFLEGQYIENSVNYLFSYSYIAYTNAAVISIFFGELTKYNELRKEMVKILENIEEISKKEFMFVLSSQDIYNKNTDAVVLVRVYDKQGQVVGYSSGFNIYPEGLIITNLHSITTGYYLDIKFPYHGVFEEVYIAGLSKTLHDIVLLKIEGKNLPVVNIDNTMETEIGDKVVVISNPEGFLNSLSEGLISGLRYLDNYPYYQMTAPISKGSSGGAVFNQHGNLIGISSAVYDSGQNLNFSIPITEISNIEIFEQYITLSQFQEMLQSEE